MNESEVRVHFRYHYDSFQLDECWCEWDGWVSEGVMIVWKFCSFMFIFWCIIHSRQSVYKFLSIPIMYWLLFIFLNKEFPKPTIYCIAFQIPRTKKIYQIMCSALAYERVNPALHRSHPALQENPAHYYVTAVT